MPTADVRSNEPPSAKVVGSKPAAPMACRNQLATYRGEAPAGAGGKSLGKPAIMEDGSSGKRLLDGVEEVERLHPDVPNGGCAVTKCLQYGPSS